MSRSNKNIAKYNNLKTSPRRSETKRSARVFSSGSAASVVDSVLLYQLVFRSKKAFLMAILLCLCFATQSVKFAQASEEELPPAEVQVAVEDVTAEQIPAPEAEPNMVADEPEDEEIDVVDSDPEPEPVTSAEDSESDTAFAVADPETGETDEDTIAPTEPASDTESGTTTSATTAPEDALEVGSSTTTEAEFNTATTSTEQATSTEVSAQTGDGGSPDTTDSAAPGSGAENADTDAENQPTEDDGFANGDDDYVEEAPTTSNDNLVFTVESDTHFSFDKNECTRIEDGTFYCQEQSDKEVLEDSLIAAPDSDGDLEIYLVKNGERYQITQNEVDDASPYYDELSNTIVWHRLLNDRYQIISYDIESGEEKQFTQTKVNNMEPARHGKYTVWQRWVENNWEVILHDGQTETQITNSARHDIAPHIRGPLVIWNSQSNDGSQELRTFDIQSKTQTTIADSEGVSVSNPRMVVMYEAMYENGDIVTKGFDLVSGKIVPLQALPKQLPEELPNSEPTEEVRALIQNKPEPKEATISDVEPSSGNGTSTAATATSQTATSSAQTLDLRSLSTSELIEHLTQDTTASSTIPDVVIESEQSGTTTQSAAQADIPDLVVPSVDNIEITGTSTQNTQE